MWKFWPIFSIEIWFFDTQNTFNLIVKGLKKCIFHVLKGLTVKYAFFHDSPNVWFSKFSTNSVNMSANLQMNLSSFLSFLPLNHKVVTVPKKVGIIICWIEVFDFKIREALQKIGIFRNPPPSPSLGIFRNKNVTFLVHQNPWFYWGISNPPPPPYLGNIPKKIIF